MKLTVREHRCPLLNAARVVQESARYCGADFVHGDPVFSNCLLNKVRRGVFLAECDVNNKLNHTTYSIRCVLAMLALQGCTAVACITIWVVFVWPARSDYVLSSAIQDHVVQVHRLFRKAIQDHEWCISPPRLWSTATTTQQLSKGQAW